MKIAILSGKGGAGKTFVSVNLAATLKHCTYVDCDVEEPNGHLFLNGKEKTSIPVYTKLPSVDKEKCDGCRKCVDFCHFNALLYLVNKPLLFPEVCHSCGGCMLVCPQHAIHEVNHEVGHIEISSYEDIKVISGFLNTGESSGIPVIKQAQAQADKEEDVIYDCPPGSACSVMETVQAANYCLLVAEPTAFGFHNFVMVYELVSLLHKPCGVVINKEDETYLPLITFCKEHNIPILMKFPYQKEVAKISAQGKLAVAYDAKLQAKFNELVVKLKGACR